ncbi:excinuclease ABC subunit UvrA [Massilia sp. CCM 8734]|uniref:excinuclease ABC subunit UvrA n=1 Tax=Massilia sp. CCM 8734 TaxID=2609283 RepID=UPI00141F4D12|nr:excinuclease ABC subunit UvrA [Massilia sp. CCM 8734]NHZ94188.1 ATP-binding cassette domain-containing protein [Massilia sp. CCM 8734]
MAKDTIRLDGVRTHNLKGVSLRIPKNQLVVVTGVSGSGKSSLIFDTLYKYAKALYLGALGSANMDAGESDYQVEQIGGVQAPVALEQSTRRLSNPRSTVGTLLGIERSLRVLFARCGAPACPACLGPVDARLQCGACGCIAEPLTPSHFSANRKEGMCLECNGMGRVTAFSEEKVVPDRARSLTWIWDNAVGGTYSIPNVRKVFEAMCADKGIALDVPYDSLSEAQRAMVLHGCDDTYFVSVGKVSNNMRFDGILGYLDKQYRNTSSATRRVALESYLGESHCTACGGARLRPESLAVRIAGYTIAELQQVSARQLGETLQALAGSLALSPAAAEVLRLCLTQCRNLSDVGLPYLTLARKVTSLSDGELQRILLAQHVASDLSGVMYILDEPSIGLHERDTRKLLSVLTQLRDMGNSVIVIEHDETIIRAADWLIEIGPGAGQDGGQVVFEGSFADMRASAASLTARCLAQPLGQRPRRDLSGAPWFTVAPSNRNNLKAASASFPFNALTCVTGVSGAGKSSLVRSVYEQAVRAMDAAPAGESKPSKAARGARGAARTAGRFDSVVNVEQKPIGRSTRSTIATYIGISDDIRDLFAAHPQAAAADLGRAHFSTNVAGGRCETCKGQGEVEVDMHFLKSDYVECPECNGMQFHEDVLAIRWEGKNIHELLALSANEALGFFAGHDQPQCERIGKALGLLKQFGIAYLTLGQSTTSLSGGEAQRINLVAELAAKKAGHTLYIFDEPTRGLHMADLAHLTRMVDSLLAQGHTVLMIEHNMDMIWLADHVIDVGPEGGEQGGNVLYSGSIDGLLECAASYTGRYLAQYRDQRSGAASAPTAASSAARDGLPARTSATLAQAGALHFPAPDQFQHTWDAVTNLADSVRDSDSAALLTEFLGEAAGSEQLSGLDQVHHAAIYLGDYENDQDVFAWFAFLDQLARAGLVRGVEHGPSYIAPKQYGTPGWWASLERADGFVIEMFCCRAFGPWLERTPVQRARLMSHAALAVSEREQVLPTLQALARSQPQVELIAFTEGDELGHCYGHLRNNHNNFVIELVHSHGAARENIHV